MRNPHSATKSDHRSAQLEKARTKQQRPRAAKSKNLFWKMKWAIRPKTHMGKMHISNWKLPIWKGYVLYNSNYMMFW